MSRVINRKMAGEEDVELRDLVAHTLETKGVLGKIRVSLCLVGWYQVSCSSCVWPRHVVKVHNYLPSFQPE